MLQYEAHFLNLLVGSQDQCITRIEYTMVIKRTFRSFMSLPTHYLYMIINIFVSNKVKCCPPIYKNIQRQVFSGRISISAKWLHEL